MGKMMVAALTRYPLFLMLGLAATAGISLLDGEPWLSANRLLLLVGVTLGTAGTLLLLAAAGLFRRVGTTVDPTKSPDALVTHGIYSLTRNPMYLGMLLLLAAEVCLLGRPLTLLSPLCFFVLMNTQRIPAEEAMVAARFGDAFTEYKARVRRWL
ncbi:methyltransferase family protein [Shewanella zhangzhouensis]|uniref:methyltransferase family protein n=1 Tax=Shewanella zhangzhouensis TaxID=2864213 RepID=UPI001C6562CD|nr:isoprenylcysteine carboxylmethyltransferase family protein [Shewanella zhangzhouensis]QYK04966.1 isoprenylcysteine carboxylmethyltransferase family protein [Shewanella zhangzhouensis]